MPGTFALNVGMQYAMTKGVMAVIAAERVSPSSSVARFTTDKISIWCSFVEVFRFLISEFCSTGKTACYNGYRNFLVETGKVFTMALQSGAEVKLLLHRHQENKRSLPWRDTGNPEDIQISEITLQQTRVEAVKDYFIRFRTTLPTVAATTVCPDEQLLHPWEGLGYYTRTRSIKECARVLLRGHGGEPVSCTHLRAHEA